MMKLYMYTFPPIHNLSFGLLQTARSKQVDHRKIYATHSFRGSKWSDSGAINHLKKMKKPI